MRMSGPRRPATDGRMAMPVGQVTGCRRVHPFGPLVISVARPCRHHVGDRPFVDGTSLRVARLSRCIHRHVGQCARVIRVSASRLAEDGSAHGFFITPLTLRGEPAVASSDRARALADVLDELTRTGFHRTEPSENARCACDQGRGKAPLLSMCEVQTDRNARDKQAPVPCPHSTASIRRLGRRGPTSRRAVLNTDAPLARATWMIVR